MFKKKVCVVIPIHSSAPSKNELLSFKQCFNILSKHTIYIIAPDKLDLDIYKNLIPNFNLISIDPKWQSSILNYNKLKLSEYFYSLFIDYEYLLTYELDAFVFKDELLYWCERGYDYIGAPWFEGFSKPTKKIFGIGNSGFSLRNIEKVKKNLKKILYSPPFTGRKNSFLSKIDILRQQNLSFLFKENLTIQNCNFLYEDRVISEWMPLLDQTFRIANFETSISFSFETNPDYLFKLNNNQLPFGCHAWEKYNPEFWQKYIGF
jgi:hypothetical protein